MAHSFESVDDASEADIEGALNHSEHAGVVGGASLGQHAAFLASHLFWHSCRVN
jgi:hypothetical protein